MQNIFIIDDDEICQMLLRRIFKKIDPEIVVSPFLDPEHALSALKLLLSNNEALPQIMFLDINMPIMDGWQFLDEFEQLINDANGNPIGSALPDIYMFSTSLDETDKKKALSQKLVKNFAIKPITLHNMQVLLNSEADK